MSNNLYNFHQSVFSAGEKPVGFSLTRKAGRARMVSSADVVDFCTAADGPCKCKTEYADMMELVDV